MNNYVISCLCFLSPMGSRQRHRSGVQADGIVHGASAERCFFCRCRSGSAVARGLPRGVVVVHVATRHEARGRGGALCSMVPLRRGRLGWRVRLLWGFFGFAKYTLDEPDGLGRHTWSANGASLHLGWQKCAGEACPGHVPRHDLGQRHIPWCVCRVDRVVSAAPRISGIWRLALGMGVQRHGFRRNALNLN